MDYNLVFDAEILKLKNDNRYRVFKQINRDTCTFPVVKDDKNRDIAVWCSNDYLGLGVHKDVINAAVAANLQYGTGSGGTRNISGTNNAISFLEDSVAKLCQKESGLVFTSGYVANVGAISAIAKIMPKIVVFSDEKNHASIISGIRYNNMQKHVFRHNDIKHLEELMSQYAAEVPKIIIFEGVYSMDGTMANVPEICKIAKKYNALTYIDEVHAVGIYGDRGGGIANLQNAESEIDIIQGNFAKGLGVMGGYIAGKSNIVDAIRCVSSDFIFTTSLPPALCMAACKAIEIAMSKEGELLRIKHSDVVFKTRQALLNKGLKVLDCQTHIIPVIIGDARLAEQISNDLYNIHQIYVQHINYPTVAVGEERLRITPTPWHTDEMITDLAEKLASELFKK